MPDVRGSQTRAEEQVAKNIHRSHAAVKKARQRAMKALPPLRQAVRNITRLANDNELERRVSGLRPDVLKWLGAASAPWVMALLRHNNIEGTCPEWLIEAAMNDDWRALELMSPK